MAHLDSSMVITITIGLVLMIAVNNRPFAITLAALAVGLTIMLTIKKILKQNQSHS
ncbi:hypothetical protein [Lentilactobacillus parakefiri]|uniref:Uncharacterized protein n=1 Tax=Lentilactobacillus parakefiri TaxID=152332 RepID=A0A224V4J6_9LACO|nr:hypothetical protein [Lentilactobacillus parakefiri]KRL60937.1 hypothetical protein FD08_GL003129 [Lentilactobacillus parakefiri DSM 10551]TDG94508.1 hypothetical protein C5L28_002645 [Lentilactobacillus parakefiri]GAW71888.1 hypothetical protein LPKJCM_00991 [Lentilactobacillus parakefiri]